VSVKQQMGYALQCDFPDCDVETRDLGDYAFWGDIDSAIDEWRDHDGFYDDERGAYCFQHVTWDEDGEKHPMQDTLEVRFMLARRRIEDRIDASARRARIELDRRCRRMEQRADARWRQGAARFLPLKMIDVPF